MSDVFDLVVLGARPAGEKWGAQAAYFGKRVAIVDPRPEPGGGAVHTGTLPSKTLRETALFLSGYRQRDLYGVSVHVSPDLAISKLIARKDAVRGSEAAQIRRNLERHGIEQIRGTARFVDPGTVEVSGDGAPRKLAAAVFLMATGSRPFRPQVIPDGDPGVLDSDTILGIGRLPRSLMVIGGGVVGCEYASTFAALGVHIDLIEGRSRLLSFLDQEIGERLLEAMATLGVEFHLGVRINEVRREEAGGIAVTLMSGERVSSEKALVASGRVGDTEALDLATVNVATDERGHVLVDHNYQTTMHNIYAAGDVIGFPALASTSMEQARVAVCHAFGFAYKRQVSDLLPYGIYTIPEVSCVGLGEEEAERRGIDAVVGRAYFRDNARGQIVGDRDGMVKLLFDRVTRALIGCHCIGERATELVHIGQTVIALGGTVETFIDMVFNYPTLSEVYKYAAYDALARMIPLPPGSGLSEPLSGSPQGAGPPLSPGFPGTDDPVRPPPYWKHGRA